MGKKIILTGAQGTGKTTLMKELTKDGTKQLSIAREAALEYGYPPQEGKEAEWQQLIFDRLLNSISVEESFVSDRGLTCVAAHTFLYALTEVFDKDIANEQYLSICKFHSENPDVLIVYLPVEFELEDDGLRNTDVDNQKTIDFLIKNLLDTSGISYITVTGSVKERLSQIEDYLKTL